MQGDVAVAAAGGARALDETEARLLLEAYGLPLAPWSTLVTPVPPPHRQVGWAFL